jgi:hypothetical protein
MTTTTIPPAPQAQGELDPRTRRLLEAPIVPTLLRLAAPNVLVMVAQASVGLIETYFVGKLGTDALAGMALVFPIVMLMQMTVGGAMGGGIASAIARALGARRRTDDADALVCTPSSSRWASACASRWRCCWAGAGSTGSWAAAARAGGGADVLQLGVRGRRAGMALQLAVGSIIRGTGNMSVPANVTVCGRGVADPAVAAADLRLGPLPAHGHRGRRGGAAAVLPAGLHRGSSSTCARRAACSAHAGRAEAALADVPRHPARRPDRRRVDGGDQPVDRHRHRAGRPFRLRRAGGLRHRVAAGVPAGAAGLRPGRAAGRHGRHLHRRRPARARAACHVGRRGAWPSRSPKPSAWPRRCSRGRG